MLIHVGITFIYSNESNENDLMIPFRFIYLGGVFRFFTRAFLVVTSLTIRSLLYPLLR